MGRGSIIQLVYRTPRPSNFGIRGNRTKVWVYYDKKNHRCANPSKFWWQNSHASSIFRMWHRTRHQENRQNLQMYHFAPMPQDFRFFVYETNILFTSLLLCCPRASRKHLIELCNSILWLNCCRMTPFAHCSQGPMMPACKIHIFKWPVESNHRDPCGELAAYLWNQSPMYIVKDWRNAFWISAYPQM